MDVKTLAKLLSELPPELPVYVWIDGDRYPIVDIDDSFVEDGWIDVNAVLVENFGGY